MIERQLRRVDPTLEGWRLRRAVQDAFDSYARYWIETFRLPTLPASVVADGFTTEGYEAHIRGGLARGTWRRSSRCPTSAAGSGPDGG